MGSVSERGRGRRCKRWIEAGSPSDCLGVFATHDALLRGQDPARRADDEGEEVLLG